MCNYNLNIVEKLVPLILKLFILIFDHLLIFVYMTMPFLKSWFIQYSLCVWMQKQQQYLVSRKPPASFLRWCWKKQHRQRQYELQTPVFRLILKSGLTWLVYAAPHNCLPLFCSFAWCASFSCIYISLFLCFGAHLIRGECESSYHDGSVHGFYEYGHFWMA